MRPTWEPSPYAKYLYMAVIGLIVLGAALGGFYLGSYTTQQTVNVAVKQIYDQGFTAGKAIGIQQANAQRDQLVKSIAANCKEWESPLPNFGINLTGGP